MSLGEAYYTRVGLPSSSTLLIQNADIPDLPLSKDTIVVLEAFYAAQYDVSFTTIDAVVACESSYHQYTLGDQTHSRGLVQISNIYHPEVSDKEAFSPLFSLDFLAAHVAAGKGNEWTCYRKLTV